MAHPLNFTVYRDGQMIAKFLNSGMTARFIEALGGPRELRAMRLTVKGPQGWVIYNSTRDDGITTVAAQLVAGRMAAAARYAKRMDS